jgi:hypothetical protein
MERRDLGAKLAKKAKIRKFIYYFLAAAWNKNGSSRIFMLEPQKAIFSDT